MATIFTNKHDFRITLQIKDVTNKKKQITIKYFLNVETKNYEI